MKVGFARNTDLQVILDTHTIASDSGSGRRTTDSGFGDITVRLKQTLWGNDSGATALAIMPYVTIPTLSPVSDREWAGGLVMPLSITFTERLSLGLMLQGDLVHSESAGTYQVECLHSAALGYDFTEEVGMYVELVGIAGTSTGYQALFNAGLTFAVTDTLVYDAGVRLGMNRAAADFGVFTGVSFRF